MKTSSKNRFSDMQSIFQTGAAKQLFIMVGIAVSVALGISLYMSISEPIYRPLDYQLTDKNMSAIVDTLEKANVKYKVNDKDGIVFVAADQLELAKLKLSAAGIPKDDNFTYSFMNDQSALTNSQFLERARYLRALENDLAKTISGIEGVTGARVHIAVPRNNLFADENNKVTASVLINVSPGFGSSKEKIRSIVQIVADSVPGLDPKDVSVSDQYGHYLSDGMDPDSNYNAAQLNYLNSVQSYYEKRIESMIVPLLGQNKVVVRVNAVVDFTQQEDAQEEYDPQKSVILSEQSDTEQSTSSGASGPPGSLSNTPPGASSSGQQSQSGNGQSKVMSTKNYNVSKTVTYKKKNASQIKQLSVAVAVDNEMVMDPKTKKMVSKPLDQDKINKITELVKTVIGFDSTRGDKVTVINSGYTPIQENIPEIKLKLWENVWFWDVIKKIIGILFGFVFLIVVYRKISNYIDNVGSERSKSMFVPEENDVEADSINRIHNAKKDGIQQLKELATNDPQKVASIIKTWVRK